MRRNRRWFAAGWALVGAVLTVGGAAVMTTAQAQQDPQQPPPGGFPGGPGGFPGGPGGGPGGFGQGGPGGFGRGMGGFGGAPVITANERFVFVLRGNTLYKLDVTNLQLLAQTQLPDAPNPGGAGAGRQRGNNANP